MPVLKLVTVSKTVYTATMQVVLCCILTLKFIRIKKLKDHKNVVHHMELVQNDLIINMTPENRSKTFQNWSKARLSSLTPKETIQSKGHNQRKSMN